MQIHHISSGNFRSAIRDCIFARKFKPDHLKAIVKGTNVIPCLFLDCYFLIKELASYELGHNSASFISGAQCYLELEYGDEAIIWCDSGLLVSLS